MNRIDIPRSSRLHPLMTGTVPRRPESAPVMLHTEITELAGKRVLVTGGTTGIGRAVGALLASYGARIFTFGRNQKPLDEALDYIRAAGGEAEGVTGDLTLPDDVGRIFARADAVFGGVDVLVNNAALPADGIMEMEDAEWRYAVEANFVGQLACARAAATRMAEAGHGHIVFIGSMSAEVREKGSSVYVATKAGIEGFAASLRKELSEKGIKVSLIEPGSVSSDMASPSAERQQEMIRDALMLRAEDIAVSVHFILTQPPRTDVILMQVRPHRQEI
jgi:NAD(P)-dependent dehydrogenase (short-subunit alcohol dehydrogenase family)